MKRLPVDIPDISDWANFEFYGLVWYLHEGDDKSSPDIGRWMGVAYTYGSDMNYSILTYIWKVITRTTVQYPTATGVQKL